MPVLEQRFELFFQDPIYLLYKNHLYNFLIRRLVIGQNFHSISPQEMVLELGCGISPILKETIGAVRTDFSWRALTYLGKCSSHPHPNRAVACDATRLPFIDQSIQTVICSEVLEHIEKDEAVLDEISRVLKPGGELLLTLPMRSELFGFDDSFVGHYRRYDLQKLLNLLFSRDFENLRSQSILGSLEKWMMEAVTRFFSILRRGSEKSQPQNPAVVVRGLAWLLFPFYVLINYLLAAGVYLQAKITPAERAVTVLIRCQKKR